jgi:squalene-hopene/tetraprenyl-beta-curcumene cyclase
MVIDPVALDECVRSLAARLLERRAERDHWDGRLASSALSTGTAILALHLAAPHRPESAVALDRLVSAGARWLIDHQNADGGWGDTTRSRSNISTTAIVWAALVRLKADNCSVRLQADHALARSEAWLRGAAGGVTPDALRAAILRRYGKDRTFSVPILTVLALAGKLGSGAAAWRSVPQLPFELAALPHGWFQHLRLPVVSYALPALIAIGQVRHRLSPSRNPLTRSLRNAVSDRTHRVLREMQPDSGGYLEATPLTSFVVMSLVGAGRADSPVVEAGVKFLVDSMRTDGSWPIDTNLATWVTSLSVGALSEAGALPAGDRRAIRGWLLRQQSTREHPFTHAAAGAWAWTPLSGGVPDADDTSGALLALRALGEPDSESIAAAAAGARWLLGVQNRDGGIPTFCRGWGTLPFDRSTPEITAHAVRAWSAWHADVESTLQHELNSAAARALRFLEASQRADGSWIPLWFGNEHTPSEDNPIYGTARVLIGLDASLVRESPCAARCRDRALRWLLDVQNADGGWGGAAGVASSMEETGAALSALGCTPSNDSDRRSDAVARGTRWMIAALRDAEMTAAPIGFYFARLWYYEELYPLIFSLDGLGRHVSGSRVPGSRAGSPSVSGP